jgi:thiol-disulfide isomerase/thioredoxin
MRALLRYCLLAGLLLGLGLCGSLPGMAGTLVNKTAPQIALRDLGGNALNLRSYRGKVVLLNFWATWCAPCQIEMPQFVEWQQRYAGRGLQIVGISMDDDPALVVSLRKKLKLNYPVAMGDEKLGALYGGILGLPVTYLIDRTRTVRAEYHGETDLKALESDLTRMLDQR